MTVMVGVTARSALLRSCFRADGRPEDLWYHPPSRPALDSAPRARRPPSTLEVRPLAKTPRTWTGARTPSGLKRVRQAQSRHEVLQPRRTAAKTYVAKALTAAAQPTESTIDPEAALAEALSALDRAAKVGAIHPNAAARRKSRLTLKVNAALGGEHVLTGGRITKTTGKAAAAKAAKARIAAGKAGKAKGAQTAAGKARAALSKTARAEAAAAKAAPGRPRPPRPRQGLDDQGDRTKASATKATATKAAPKKAARRRPRRQGRPEGDGQGRAQGEEGRDQGVARQPTPHRRRPGSPGAFRFRGLESGALTSGEPAPASAFVSATASRASGGTRRTAPAPPRPPSVVSSDDRAAPSRTARASRSP